MAEFFDSMDDVLAELQRQNALPDFTNPAALSGIEAGRSFEAADAESSFNKIKDATKKAYDAGLESRAMWNKVESKLRQQGYRMVIRRAPRGHNEFEIFAVPDNLSKQKREDMKVLNQYPSIVWSGIDDKGLTSRYGQKAIDQGRLDYIDGALAFYTSSTQQAQAILNRLTNPRGGSSTKYNDYARLARNSKSEFERQLARRHIKSSVANAERHANAGYNAVNSYQTDELWKMMQGTGTARSIAQRKSLTSIRPMVDSILNQVYKSALQAYGKANPSRQMSSQQFKAHAEQDIFNTLYWYLQNRAVTNLEAELTEAAKKGWGGGYLWNNAEIRKVLQNAGRQLHGLGVDVGLTSESSVNQMIVNMLRHGDIDVHGSLGDKSGRKLMQTAQMRQRSDTAMKKMQSELEKNGLYGRRRIFTGWEKANGLDAIADELAQTSVMFATGEEIRKAQQSLMKKGRTGTAVGYGSLPHGGGIFSSKALGDTLYSQQQRSYSVSAATFEKAYDLLLGRLINTKTRSWAVEKGAKGLNDADAAAFRALIGGLGADTNVKDLRAQLEAQTYFADLDKTLKHQASRDILRQHKGINLKSAQEIQSIIERDPMGHAQVLIEWLENHKMRSGEKLLGGQAHFVKGRAKEIEDFAALAEEIWLGRGKDQATAQRLARSTGLLMEPENLTSRNADAFLSAYLHQITRTLGGPGVSPKALDAFISHINTRVGDQDWLQASGNGWVTTFDRFARKPNEKDEEMAQRVQEYVDQLHAGLAKATTLITDTALKNELRMLQKAVTVTDGKLTYDPSSFLGATTVGQHAAFDYGEPGSAVVNADYRLIGAVSRGILRSTLNGRVAPEYAQALLGRRTRTGTPNGQYAWQLDLDDTGKIVNAGQFGGTAESRAAHERWVKSLAAVHDARDWMNTKGATWRAADWIAGGSDIVLGHGTLAEFLKAQGINAAELSADQLAALEARYLDVSGLNANSFAYNGEFDEGHMSAADYASSFGRLAALEKNNPTGRVLFVPLTGGIAGTSFGKTITTGAIALPRMDALGGAVETLLDSGRTGYDIPDPLRILPSLISSQSNVHYAATDPNWSESLDKARENFNEAALNGIGRMLSSVESKNGSVWQAGNKAELYHSAIRHATAPDVLGGEWGNLAKWGNLADVAHRMSTEDLALMLQKQDPNQTREQYLEQLRTQYYYLWSNLVDNPDELKDKWEAARATFKGTSGLRQHILDSVTRGTEAFNTRLTLANNRGVQLHGLSGLGIRFPLSNAEDTRAADIFADPDLLKDEIQVALGAGAGQNLDWDGDTYATVLQMLGTNDPEERRKLLAGMTQMNAADSALMRRQADAFRAQYSKELEAGVPIASIVNSEAQEVSAVKSRLNKGYTGRFSNQFQALSETLSLNEPWGTATGINADDRAAFLQNQVARMLLESFTQDAISSKKVRKRIEGRHGSAAFSNAEYLSDMDKLYDLLQDSKTYNGPGGLKALLQRGQEMGVLGEDGSLFDWRLTSQLMAKLDQYDEDEAAKALGVSVQTIREWKNDRTGALGPGLEDVVRIIGRVNDRVRSDTGHDIGSIIRDKINRPGGIDAEPNPAYRAGHDVGTGATYDEVKAANAALADMGAKAGAFGEALQKAADAVGEHTDAVKADTNETKKHDEIKKREVKYDENLAYSLAKRADEKAIAVTKMTGAILGGNFASEADQTAFEAAMLGAYRAEPTVYANGITALAGYDAERFKTLRNGWLGRRRGSIADQAEQLISEFGLSTFHEVHSVDDLFKLADSNAELRQRLYEYNPDEHQIGLGVLLGRGDASIYGAGSAALKAAQDNRALQEAMLGAENIDADQYAHIMQGINFALAFAQVAQNQGGQIVGHEFGVVGGNGAGDSAGWNHGRIDLLMKSTDAKTGQTILDVFDKKTIGDVAALDKYGPSLNYAAQVAVYAEDLRQLASYIQGNKIANLGQLTDDKEYYQKQWLGKGGQAITEEMFEALKDPQTIIRAALMYADDLGNIRSYNVGSGQFSEKAFLRRLAGYAMHGTPEAKWETGDTEILRRMIEEDNRGLAMGGHRPAAPAGGGGGANHTGGSGGLSGLLGRQLSMYFGRILGGTGLYRLFAKVRQGITSLVKEATELDKTLTNLQITTGGTREDTRQLLSTYAQLGRQLGATTQEVAASALEWQRQGYEAGEVADLVTSSLYLSKLGMIDASTATQNLTSALKGFKIAASESMDVVDKLTAIDLKAATSAGEIANGLAQFANIGSLSGVNIDEAAAYVATIADVTQMSGSSAGQALKTIISRYGNVKAGAFNKLTLDADTGDGTTLNDVERVLSKLGISIRDSNLSFKDFSTILEEIAARWQSLDNVSQRAIANAFAGVRQQEAFTTLLQNWDKYQELLETSQRSKGTASTKYSAYQQSLQAAQSARKTTWEQLANNADISELLIAINKAGEWLGKLVPWLLEHGTQIMISLGQILELFGRGPLTQGLKYFQEQGLLKERAMTREKHKQHKLEQQSTAEDRKQTNLEQQQTNSASTSSKGSKTNAMSNASIAMIGASYALGQIASGITAYQTGGLTHSFTQANGESVTVNSSRRAKEAGRATAALWSAAIPLVGSWIGSYQAEKIAARIDKKRDEANEITRVAQENLKVLSATNNNLVTMVHLRNAATAAEEAERDAATAEYLATIYKSENAAVRDLLTQQLTRIDDKLGSIRSVTEAMHTGTERDRARASHALELAQLQVTHAQDRQSRAAENYAAQEELREAYLQYNMSREGYTQYGTTAASDAQNKATALESGMLTGGAVFGGSAVTMLGTAAAASASVPVYGWIAAVLLAIGAGIAGYFVKYNGETAKSEVAEGWNQYWSFKDTWDELGLDNKIKLLTDTEAELYRSMDEGNDAAAAQLEATRELRKSFESYRDQLRLQEDADNKARMDEALLYAGWQADTTFNTGAGDIRTTKYFLKDLNLTQAKNYGQEALYAALAAALGEEGLSGTTIKVGDRYTEYFTTYARRIMSENEAVGSVLSGEAYTLNEALDKLGAKSDQFSQAIMQDFARAMRVANDELGQYTELLGELTLAELLMSTGELEEEFDNWSGLLGKVADSTQSVTKWMTDIVEHYPDLINYMSNTPVLIQKIVDKLMDLNNQTMRQQYEEYGTSEPFWEKTVKPGAQAWLDAQVEAENITAEQREAVLELVRDKNLTRLNEALTKIGAMAGLDENSELYTTYDLMRQAVTAGTSGVTLRSDIWTEQTQKLTNFIAEQLRTQIAALEAQKEALQDVNKQRQFEVDLLNARNKLSDALNQKQRVYRTGVGFVYEPDQGAIKKAQEELKEVQLQKDVSKITKQIDTLSSEAKQWETWWSRRTQELEENVFADIWGGKNLENFKSSLFGNQNTLLNVTGNGLKVDAASMTNQLTTLFGTEGTFTNSLQTLIWGMDTAPTWFSQTFATSLAPLSTYFTKLNEDQARNNQQLLADVEAAYKTYKEMAWERGQGHAVDTDLWNATLQNYQDVFNKAASAGAITEDWAFDKKYYFGQRDHSEGSAYEYLYNPYYLGTHADTLDALKYTAEPVTSKVGEPFKQEYAVQIGSNPKRQLQTGSDGTAWTWAPVEMTDYAAIDAGISTGLTGDLRNALASPTGKKAKAWYWTPETLNSYGGELSSGMADTKLKGILQSSSDWASVAQKLAAQDYPELLIWTPDYGYVLLSGGQAYMASYKTSSNEERERKIASYAEILNHYWRNYSDSDSLLKIPFFEMKTSDLEFMEANWPQITALLKAPSGKIDKWASQFHPSAYASGSFGLGSLGSELVNELGTEAIVTPAGTITALPSHTGIVPADITRNLWQLGEVAPSILRVAEAIAPSSFLSGSNRSAVTDQSFNINNLSMSVNADDSFDVDAFIEAIKSRVALTHHAHR